MQIVITIDDKTYENYKYGLSIKHLGNKVCDALIDAMENGVVLPKGHGDLKDINDLCCKSRYGCKDNCEYIHTCNIYGAKTIIDADKESD